MVPGAVFGDVLTWELVHLVQLTVTTEALAASKRVEDKGQMGCYSVDVFAEAGNIALRRRPAKLGCIEGAVRWFGGGSGTVAGGKSAGMQIRGPESRGERCGIQEAEFGVERAVPVIVIRRGT